MCFCSLSVHCNTLIDFQMFNQPYILYINSFSHGIQTFLYIASCDLLILLRIFVYVHEVYWPVALFSGDDLILPSQGDKKSPPLFFFLKKFVYD